MNTGELKKGLRENQSGQRLSQKVDNYTTKNGS